MKRGRDFFHWKLSGRTTALAEQNPFTFDSRVTFDEPKHVYDVDQQRVGRSVTTLVKLAFADNFDPVKIINKNLTTWRNNKSSKYHELVSGKTDQQAQEAILCKWEKGRDSGTDLHKSAELWMNGTMPPPGDEIDLFKKGWQKLQNLGHTACRTELSVFWDRLGEIRTAGQIDLLTCTRDGYAIVDIKRSDKNLTSVTPSFGRTGATGTVFEHLDDTPHMRYSLQLSCYAEMFHNLTGETVTQMLLLQVDPGNNVVSVIPCTDLRQQARIWLSTSVTP
jgi:hypothetical protein